MEGTAQRTAHGFVKRTLLRSRTETTVYYYQSFWESKPQADAFGETAALESLLTEFG